MTRHVNTIHPELKFDDIVLIIKPTAQKKIQQSSEEQHAIEDIKYGNILEKSGLVIDFDKFDETKIVCEQEKTKNSNTVVIIEDRVLQKPKELLKNEEVYILCENEDLAQKGPTKVHAKDYYKTDFNVEKHAQAQVATPLASSNVKTDGKGNLPQVEMNNTMLQAEKQVESQIQYILSPSTNLEQNITSQNKSIYDNKVLNSILIENKQSSDHITETLDSRTDTNTLNCLAPKLSSTAAKICDPIDQTTHNKASVIRSIGNVKKMLTSTPTTTIVTTKSNVLLDCEYKHKKYNRHYNVDLYRKILGCDDVEDDDSDEDQHHSNHQTDKQNNNSCDATNATPVHWRKSFKNSYETSAL